MHERFPISMKEDFTQADPVYLFDCLDYPFERHRSPHRHAGVVTHDAVKVAAVADIELEGPGAAKRIFPENDPQGRQNVEI